MNPNNRSSGIESVYTCNLLDNPEKKIRSKIIKHTGFIKTLPAPFKLLETTSLADTGIDISVNFKKTKIKKDGNESIASIIT